MKTEYPHFVENFVEVVNSHGWRSLAPFSWDGSVLTRIHRQDDGQVLRIQMDSTGYSVEPRADVEDVVMRMLNRDFDVRGFQAFARKRPELRKAAARGQGRMLRSPSLFEDVVKTILTTNTTWNMTKAMVRRLADTLGEPWPGDPVQRAFPTPEALARADLSMLKLGYRVPSIAELAQRVVAGSLDLAAVEHLPAADRHKALLGIRGIGPYGAAHLAVLLNDFSRLPVDSWARMLLGKKLGRPVTDAEVHRFFEPYQQWRYLAYRFYDWERDRDVEWW